MVRDHKKLVRAEGVGFEPTMDVTTHSGFQVCVLSGYQCCPDLLRSRFGAHRHAAFPPMRPGRPSPAR